MRLVEQHTVVFFCLLVLVACGFQLQNLNYVKDLEEVFIINGSLYQSCAGEPRYNIHQYEWLARPGLCKKYKAHLFGSFQLEVYF